MSTEATEVSSEKVPSPPAALELVIKGQEEKIVAYACPTCGALFTTGTFGGGDGGDLAAEHMASTHCHHYCACGEPTPIGRTTMCAACWQKGQAEKTRKIFELAKKIHIEDYTSDNPIFWEDADCNSGILTGDGYFQSIEELLDRCEEEGLDVPKYVWPCIPVKLSMSSDWLLEQALQEHHEDARDEVTPAAEKELQELLNQWCSKQTVTSWQPDYRTAILLHPEE